MYVVKGGVYILHSNLGQKIKAARKAAKLTQRELAEKLGKNFSTIQKYENGIVEPPISLIPEIAKAIGISPIELMETAIPWPTDMQPAVEARERREKLISAYALLNDAGQEEAVKRVEELTQIPKYKS